MAAEVRAQCQDGRLKARIENLPVKKAWVAREAGISLTALTAWGEGKYLPSVEAAVRLHRVLRSLDRAVA